MGKTVKMMYQFYIEGLMFQDYGESPYDLIEIVNEIEKIEEAEDSESQEE